jgi:hypothetical protein
MRANHTSFLVSPLSPYFKHLPRETRLAIRDALCHPAKPKTEQSRTPWDLDATISDAFSTADPCDDSAYYCTNTVDPGFDLDGSAEFNDSDGSDELSGLTIVDPGQGNIRRWLKGYDVL